LGCHEFDVGPGQGVEEPRPVFAFGGEATYRPDATPDEQAEVVLADFTAEHETGRQL
jgi:hypothetical protein